jgi:regulatory protein
MGNQPPQRDKVRIGLDQAKLGALALHYVGRYATTQAKLRHYLNRKLRERGWAGDSDPCVESIINRLVVQGYINDRSFAEARAAALSRRGYGAVRIDGALRQAGIDAQASKEISALDPDSALAVALRFAKRKSIGPFSRADGDDRTRQRMMAAFARAGHSFDVARAIMAMRPADVADAAI